MKLPAYLINATVILIIFSLVFFLIVTAIEINAIGNRVEDCLIASGWAGLSEIDLNELARRKQIASEDKRNIFILKSQAIATVEKYIRENMKLSDAYYAYSDSFIEEKDNPIRIIEITAYNPTDLPTVCTREKSINLTTIHINGEEAGITQWKDAIRAGSKQWIVVCPPKLENIFKDICEVITSDKLDLNVSLRSHLADDVSKWVAKLLDEDIKEAMHLSESIHNQGFNMYVTRNLIRAKNYCRNRYTNNSIKRYGLVCSSKANILQRYGVDNSYNTTKLLEVGPWYNEPAGNMKSCCQLDKVVTEFSCQGLELDMPIVCWGEDLLWNNGSWKRFKGKSKCKDPHQIRLNSYRVLLTRGRDGLIVYIPDDRILDETYEILNEVGLREL